MTVTLQEFLHHVQRGTGRVVGKGTMGLGCTVRGEPGRWVYGLTHEVPRNVMKYDGKREFASHYQ